MKRIRTIEELAQGTFSKGEPKQPQEQIPHLLSFAKLRVGVRDDTLETYELF